jgi:AmiR/NasT family two-component response regulator
VTGQVGFRDLRAIVSHPRDTDGELLIRCLQRLDVPVQCLWPPPDKLEKDINLLLCLVDPTARPLLETTTTDSCSAVVGILDPQRPENMRLFSEVTPHAALIRPIDQAAILPSIILAQNNAKFQQRQQTKINKLEETLRSYRKVEQAKAILMRQRDIDEPEAYNFLREQAMRRRVPVGVIASAVVELNEVLSEKKK